MLSNTQWDLIIFDEAHKLSAYEYGIKKYRSHRYEAASILSKQCEHILLLTATPHRGRTDTFKCLMQLLDEDMFATADVASDRVKEISETGANKFFIRRLKEDMKDWDGNPLYKQRFTKTYWPCPRASIPMWANGELCFPAVRSSALPLPGFS